MPHKDVKQVQDRHIVLLRDLAGSRGVQSCVRGFPARVVVPLAPIILFRGVLVDGRRCDENDSWIVSPHKIMIENSLQILLIDTWWHMLAARGSFQARVIRSKEDDQKSNPGNRRVRYHFVDDPYSLVCIVATEASVDNVQSSDILWPVKGKQ